MTELQLFDVAGNGLAAYQQGQDRARQQGLRSLMGDYAATGNADLRAIAQNGGNPLAVRDDMRGQSDQQASDVGRYAQMFLQLPPDQKQAQYPQLVQMVNALKMQHPPIPNEYNPAFDAGIEKFAQALSGQHGASTGIQSTFVDASGNRMGVTRDGRTVNLGQNAPNTQIIEGAGGFYGVDKGNLSARPVTMGGQMPPQAQQRPASAFTLDDAALQALSQVPPQERAAALQAMISGGDFHAGPDGQAVQGMSPGFGGSAPMGQQLQPAPKPAAPRAPTELEKRVEMARSMGATPEQVRAMVVGGGQSGNAQTVKTSQATAAKLAQFGTVQRQIDRLEQAAKSIGSNRVFDGGPIDQYALKFSKQGQELQQASASVMPVLTALTRVPGVGSQSDLEARLAQLQLPSAEFPPEVNAKAVESLRAYMADLKAAYQNVGGKSAAPPAGVIRYDAQGNRIK